MGEYRRLWTWLTGVMVASFAVLGYYGWEIYRMQGLDTTPVHGHTALFGVYGMLGLGLMQTWASVDHGYWFARSPEFTQSGLMGTFRWLRVFGDTIFAFGILAMGWFVVGLKTGWSISGEV